MKSCSRFLGIAAIVVLTLLLGSGVSSTATGKGQNQLKITIGVDSNKSQAVEIKKGETVADSITSMPYQGWSAEVYLFLKEGGRYTLFCDGKSGQSFFLGADLFKNPDKFYMKIACP